MLVAAPQPKSAGGVDFVIADLSKQTTPYVPIKRESCSVFDN
jgi:hypothetical protein